MLTQKILGAVPAILLALLLGGCQKNASEEIDFGKVTNSAYTNAYFGLSVQMPKNWVVQDQETQRQMMKTGAKIMAGDDATMKAATKASEMQTVNLFAVFENEIGSRVAFNPNIISVAERVRQLPGIKRGSDYHFQARQLLARSPVKMNFTKDDYSVKLGGVEFDVMDVEVQLVGKSVKQRYYSAVMKGYALNFITSYTTAEQEAALQAILDSITFK